MVTRGNIVTHLRGLIIFLPWLAWLGIADLLLSLLLPVRLVAPDLVYNISSRVAVTVWWSIQAIFEWLNGARITISGDELPPDESAVVVCNHVGWADFYMIQALAIKAGMLSRQRYFAKAQLKYVPFLGWGLWAIGFPLLSRNWLKDKSELEKVFSDLARRKWPVCMFVSFVSSPHTVPQHSKRRQLTFLVSKSLGFDCFGLGHVAACVATESGHQFPSDRSPVPTRQAVIITAATLTKYRNRARFLQ